MTIFTSFVASHFWQLIQIRLSLDKSLSSSRSCTKIKFSNKIVYIVRLFQHAFAVGWMGLQQSMAGWMIPKKVKHWCRKLQRSHNVMSPQHPCRTIWRGQSTVDCLHVGPCGGVLTQFPDNPCKLSSSQDCRLTTDPYLGCKALTRFRDSSIQSDS